MLRSAIANLPTFDIRTYILSPKSKESCLLKVLFKTPFLGRNFAHSALSPVHFSTGSNQTDGWDSKLPATISTALWVLL